MNRPALLTPAAVLTAVVLTAVVLLACPTTQRPRPAPAETDAKDVVQTRLDVLAQRIAVRDRLALEVADGRRSVFEAAALFRELDRSSSAVGPPHPNNGEPHLVPFPTATEDEMYCLQVARWTYHALLRESPDRAAAVVARLADEVRAEIRARGAVRLPDPATLPPVEQLLGENR